MPSDLVFELRAQACLTKAQDHASAMRVGLLRAANAGMKAEWQLRTMGRTIGTEQELEDALTRARVAPERRSSVAARIRPYSRIPA